MSLITSQLTGRPHVQEDVPPHGIPQRQPLRRDRDRQASRRRTAATAMLGVVSENDDDESIIPSDAEEMDSVAGPSGIRLDPEQEEKDKEPREPDHPRDGMPGTGQDRLLSPRDILVAPDVTPQALEPLDASDVPQGKPAQTEQPPRYWSSAQPGQADPMSVLLGRTSNPATQPKLEPEQVVTAEAAQATVNTLLNAGGGASGAELLRPKQPMPDPAPGDAGKIMEAFDRYGPKRNWNF